MQPKKNRSSRQRAPAVSEGRRSRFARWRAASIALVHVAMAAHVAHWRLTGRTLAPIGAPAEVVVSLGYGPDRLGDLYEEIEPVAVTSVTFGTLWRDGLTIYVARRSKRSLWDVGDRFRFYV